MRSSPALEATALLAAALVGWLVFERAGLDDWLTSMAFDPARRDFPLRDSWWLAVLGHTGIKYAALAAWLAALAIAIVPFPRMRAYRREAAHAAAGIALATVVVLVLRNASAHSCPWDLAAYGGKAEWFALLEAVPATPGPGRCMPAAHASSGFALFAVFFALRRIAPRAAQLAFAAAVLIGLAASGVQVARGAHFASHVLWTALIAYGVTLALDRLLAAARVRRPALDW